MDVVDNCYLIHHASQGYMLWDTGVTDALYGRPERTAADQWRAELAQAQIARWLTRRTRGEAVRH